MAEKKTYTYDPDKVIIQLDGVYLTGFSDDAKITVEKNEDNVIPKVGVDGSVHYTLNHDETAKAKLPLMSTSPQINFITDLADNKRDFNFTMVDMNDNGRNISCDECRILKSPDYSRKKEAEGVEFEVFIPFFYNKSL
ncbi:conserved domain protein [Peptoniphilus sp. oral taxon 375 str. F0436]|nr:conserved domain protein [Peptoniphilus sp. oral taxon 375 str. F0436]